MSTKEGNIAEIWTGDLLDRKNESEFLLEFLIRKIQRLKKIGKKSNYTINIDANWGQGKTFFLDNIYSSLKSKDYLVVYIDAWRIDHIDDPIVPIMAEIEACLKPHIRGETSKKYLKITRNAAFKIAMNMTKGVAQTALKRYVGAGLDDIIGSDDESEGEIFTDSIIDSSTKEFEGILDNLSELAIATYTKEKNSEIQFRENLGKIIDGTQSTDLAYKPMFILVDELDRCRPVFSIKLLERLKHIFSVNNIVTIVATDTEQLKHSICSQYGKDFDALNYLKRFFDRTYKFRDVNLIHFIEHCVSQIDTNKLDCPEKDFSDVILSGTKHFGLTLRDVRQCLDIVEDVLTVWNHKFKIEFLFLFAAVVKFHRDGRVNLVELNNFCKGWLLSRQWSRGNWDSGRTNRAPYDVNDIVNGIIVGCTNIQDAVRRAPSDGNDQYVYDVFSIEFNSSGVRQNGPSVQKYIPELVLSVSQLSG